MRVQDKVCVVTGAGGGIGRAIALGLAAEGARLCLTDVQEEHLAETMALLGHAQQDAPHPAGDLAQGDDAWRIISSALDTYGRIDVLVNAHGMTHALDVKLPEVPEDVFDRTVAVNLKAIYHTCRFTLPAMRAQGSGSIVNIASVGALTGHGGAAYTASKGAMTAMTRHIAWQEAQAGIRANTVLPGFIDTPMVNVFHAKVGMEKGPTLPGTMNRMGRPEEVANVVTFLASDESSFVTGASYVVDGGVTPR